MIQDTNMRDWQPPSVALDSFDPPEGTIEGAKTAGPEISQIRFGFRIGNIGLLIEPRTTSEVMERISIYPLPNTPPWLLGLMNLRGNLVPVFDLYLLLETGKSSQEARMMLVLDEGDAMAAVLIDSLPQSLNVGHKLQRSPPGPGAIREHVTAAYARDGAIWLDFDHREFFRSLGRHVAA